jgi:chromosomal replication initiation ATPase DnaA
MTVYSYPGLQSPEEIICREWGIDTKDLHRRTRQREVVDARFVVYKYLREIRGVSFSQIGRQFGFDHATVMNGISKINDVSLFDKNLRHRIETTFDKIKKIYPNG